MACAKKAPTPEPATQAPTAKVETELELRTALTPTVPELDRRSVAETVNALVEEERMTALAEVVAETFARMIASDVADDRRVALTRALAANDPDIVRRTTASAGRDPVAVR